MNEKKHATFSSRFGYVMVAAGAAIGLGNIWRFPYMAYRDGGGIFILIYIIVVALVGKAGIEMESAIGRNGRTNAVGCYAKIDKRSKIVGWIGILFTFMLDMYYSCGSRSRQAEGRPRKGNDHHDRRGVCVRDAVRLEPGERHSQRDSHSVVERAGRGVLQHHRLGRLLLILRADAYRQHCGRSLHREGLGLR